MNCFPPLREEDGAGYYIPPLAGLYVVKSDQHHAWGFTLVELITIILVLSVIAALAVPRFVGRNAFDERGFSDQVIATFRFAQKTAIAKRREVCVTLGAASVSLAFNPSTIAGAACSTSVSQPGDAAPYVVAPPSGVTLAFPNAVFRFNGLGQPIADPGGGLLANQVITVTGTSVRSVTVQAETGHVF